MTALLNGCKQPWQSTGNRLSSCGLNEFTILLECFRILLSQLNLANTLVKSPAVKTVSSASLLHWIPWHRLGPASAPGQDQSRGLNISVWNTPVQIKLRTSIPSSTPQSCKHRVESPSQTRAWHLGTRLSVTMAGLA